MNRPSSGAVHGLPDDCDPCGDPSLPDSDGDGIPDDCDGCPTDPDPANQEPTECIPGGACGSTTPEDLDGDGVVSYVDAVGNVNVALVASR